MGAHPEATAAVGAAQASPGVLRLVEGFRAHIEELLDESLGRMQDEIPSYRSADPALVESVREHVRLHFEALMSSLSEDRPITREDLLFVRPAATYRARSGVPLADFMHAFRIGQREIWKGLAVGVTDDETRGAALSVVEEVIQYLNLSSTHAAEVYVEVEGLLQAHGERVTRVAKLVAEGVPTSQVFAAVAEEVGLLLGVDSADLAQYGPDSTSINVASWSAAGNDVPVGTVISLDDTSVAGRVLNSGRSERLDTYEGASREVGGVTSVGVPVVVDGRLWGAIAVSSRDPYALPPDTESKITAFTELAATAISNTEARTEKRRLADEQAALRRVATLVARGVPPQSVLAAIAEEVAQVLEVEQAALLHYEGDGTASVVADRGAHKDSDFLGKRHPLDGDNVTARVFKTGRTARIDEYPGTGALGEQGNERGVRSAVGCPIFVEGGLWGTLVAGTDRLEPLPADVESRIAGFTELAATAIADTEARSQVERLADEQSALRRVATLVAEGVAPPEVFAAVAEEVGQLLGVDSTHMARYGPDSTSTSIATWSAAGNNVPVGTVISLDETSVTGLVLNSGRPERLDTYKGASPEVVEIARELNLRSSVAAPVIVDGHLWGAISVSSKDPYALPPDTESRITGFTELVATAISNTEARTETRRLAEEQAALRRVATLVAREAPASEVFAKVAEEVGLLLDVENVWVALYEPDGNVRIVASWGELDSAWPVGTRLPLDGKTLAEQVRQAGRPVRIDNYKASTPEIAEMGLRAVVGSPIVVDGRLWGATLVATRKEDPMPADAESRVEEFTELVAAAVSNIQARSDLAASRARLVAATDEERRRVVRDLHDGAQQRLVHTVITINLARRALETEKGDAPAILADALQHAEEATAELRELAHGILPSVLTRGGLRAGVSALASRMPVPVETSVSDERLPATVEATAYFIVGEALTNVAKHAHADHATVTAQVEDGALQVQVRDDGVGGAEADGSGLVGLGDRVAAHDGTLRVESPPEGGTLVAAAIPVR